MDLFTSTALRVRAAFRALTLSSSDPALRALFGYEPSASGVGVNEYTALNASAVWNAVQLISGSVGSLPLHLYRRRADGGKERADDHPLYQVMHDEPNSEMTSMLFRETSQSHVLTWGNTYAEIERDKGGRPLALWPLTPDRVQPDRDLKTKELVYRVRQPCGVQTTLPRDAIFHLPGLGFDGVVGYSVIRRAKEAIGLAMATERFGAGFFGRGTRPSGVLEYTKGRLSDKARLRLREDWDAMHAGTENAHRPAVLEDGVTWKAMSINPEDAQFLETRRFQVEEIARWFNVPLHMLKEMMRATFNNVEQMELEFVVHTLRPWLVRWEQELNRKLLTQAERKVLFFEHSVDGLLRGDIKTRFEAYAIGRQWGWYCADDVLEKENMNPLPNGAGKMYLVPVNMTTPEKIAAAPPPGSAGPAAPPAARDVPPPAGGAVHAPAIDPERLASAHRAVVLEVTARLVKKEANALRRAARSVRDLLAWDAEFYPAHELQLAAALLPAVTAHLVAQGSAAEPAAAAAAVAREYVQASRRDLAEDLALVQKEPGPTPVQDVMERVAARWEIARPGELAERVLRKEGNHEPAVLPRAS